MGLGLEISAPLPTRGWLRRTPTAEALLDEVAAEARACIDEPLLREHAYLTRDEDDDELCLWLHPGTEPIEFSVLEGRLTCSAKTNPAGPGYHVYVVELLERLGERLKLQWEWLDADGEPGDECGYHESRDFESVQAQMMNWVHALCRHLVDSDLTSMSVCLPMGGGPVLENGIATPVGQYDPDWLSELAAPASERSWKLGMAFFSWWDRGCDAEFWRRYGTVIATMQLPWHPPESPEEERLYRTALDAFDKCRELDPHANIPDLEIAEMRRISEGDVDGARAPNAVGMGYRRRLWRWQLPGEWFFETPGYFYDEYDDGTTVIWFGHRTCRFTTYSADGPAETLLGKAEPGVTVEPNNRIAWHEGHLIARAAVSWTDDEGGYWILSGCVATDGHLCVATICFGDEADRQWAIDTFRSISHPPPA